VPSALHPFGTQQIKISVRSLRGCLGVSGARQEKGDNLFSQFIFQSAFVYLLS
jgi:hypothetical protein